MNNFFKKNKNIFLSIIISLAFAIVAYQFTPSEKYDLYQYRKWCNIMLTLNMQELIEYIFLRGEFIIMSYFFLIAKIGNIRLLQFFPVLIIYIILSYIVLDYSTQKNIKKRYISFTFLILFSLFKFIFAVSSFRYVLAYSIFVLAIYFDFFKQRKKTSYLLYVLPIFIHASVIILILIRLIYNIKNEKIRVLLYLLLIVSFTFPNIMIYTFGKMNTSGYFNEIISKINLYLINEKVKLNLQYVFRIIQTILMLLLTLYENNKKELDKITYKYHEMFVYISIVAISLVHRFSFFMRMVDLLTFLFIIILLNFFKNIKIKNKVEKIIIIIMLIMVFAGVKIQIPIFLEMF